MPHRLRLAVLLAAWCGLRYGEVTELRRRDFTLTDGTGVLRVERAVVYANGVFTVKRPKSKQGRRTVHIPPFLVSIVAAHLLQYAPEADRLLFPAAGDTTRHLHATTLARHFRKAATVIGIPGLHFHDLRHTAAVMAAHTGATIKELMVLLGHSTPEMALRYQHVANGRQELIARKLSDIAQQVL